MQSMSCSKDCKCSHNCSNKPFRKDKRLKVIKVRFFKHTCLLRQMRGYFKWGNIMDNRHQMEFLDANLVVRLINVISIHLRIISKLL